LKFDNPFNPPKLKNENNISPQKKFQRELYEQCNAIFSKTDTWDLSFYCKYLGVYTLLRYYSVLHLRNISGGSGLNNNINNTLENSVKVFDGKFLPSIKATHIGLLNDILNANREPIGRLQALITAQKELYPKDPEKDSDNVAKKIYEVLRSQLKSTLSLYLADDGNYNATLIRNGMEFLFLDLLTNLQPYREYFKNNSLVDLYTFKNLEKSVSKISYESDEVKDGTIIAKTLNNKGLNEIDYQNNTNWKNEFKTVYDLINNILKKYDANNNILYSSVLNISNEEYNTWSGNQTTFSAITFPIALQSNSTEAKIAQDEQENEIIISFTGNNLKDQKVFYYNAQNIRIYNEIASYAPTTKIITFKNAIGTLSSSNKNVTLVLFKSGASLFSNTFPSSLSFSRSSRSPFKITLKKDTTTIYENNFSFNDTLLNTNILSFGTPDKISNALFYNNNKNDIDKKSELKLLNNNIIKLTKDGSWIKISKIPLSFEPTQNLVYSSALGYGFYTPFILKTAGMKYISFDVPTDSVSIFQEKIDAYIVRSNRFPDDNDYTAIKLTLISSTNNNITTLSSQFDIAEADLDKYFLINPTAENKDEIINTNYFLIFHIKSDDTSQFNIRFTSLNLSETNNANSYTFNNIDDFIKKLYDSTNNRYDFVNYITFSKSNNRLKISSEPQYIGAEYNLNISNIISGLTFNKETASGSNPEVFSNSGKEKKFYTNFISYLKKVFIVLNNYALARLMVPEAFEEEDFFNNDVKVGIGKEEMKGLLSDLLEDSGLSFTDFNENLNSDPRAKFLKETSPQQDFAKELQWKSGSLGSLMNQSTLNTIKSTLNIIKSTLKRIKSLLDAVRAFIEILSELLELAEDLFAAVLETVIGQIEKVINNISSTGIYFLPLLDIYERKITNETIQKTLINETNSLAPKPITPEKWEKNFDTSNANSLIDFEETSKILYNLDINNQKVDIAAKTENSNEIDIFIEQCFPLRSTNYEEFIQNIINCLTDEDDVPYAGDFEKLKKAEGVDKLKEIFGQGFNRNTWFRPGAPTWSSGTTVKIMIGALTLPAPETIRGGSIGTVTLLLKFLKILRFITKKTNPSESDIKEKDPSVYAKIDTQYALIKRIDAEIEKLENNSVVFDFLTPNYNEEKIIELKKEKELAISKIKKLIESIDEGKYDKIQSWINTLEKILGIAKEKEPEKSTEQNSSSSSNEDKDYAGIANKYIRDSFTEGFDDYTAGLNNRFGMPPNFYGVSLGSLFPVPFTYLKFLLDKLRKWNRKQDGPTLSETLEEWLEWFEKKIREIEDIIFLIDQIIELIDAILGISLTYLIIDTTNGIPDIIAQLESASGFPNEDKNQIILGFLAGFGFPNPDDPSLNLSEYFSSVSSEFNQDAQDLISDLALQNESDGIGIINKILPK
jgi:hypothetical protein